MNAVGGAFLFGLGMQLGGGCASGTLYSAGGGNTRMFAVLAAFIAGSVIGTAHMPWWTSLPATKPISLITSLGTFTALAVSLAVFALLGGWLAAILGLVPANSLPRLTCWRRKASL